MAMAPTDSFEMDALDGKTTPVAADTLLLKDTEDGLLLKEVTFANLQLAILNDPSIVTLTGVQTLENKTLDMPTIIDFSLATHDHEDAAGGGTLLAVAISDFDTAVSANSDVTANTAKVTNANHTGDATGDTALTIADDAVTYAKMQNVVADDVLLGNIAGAGGIVTELTGTQVNTILPVFTDTLKGLVPLSGGGMDNFLRADGTWVPPPGAGASAPFTWGASDEDASIITGLLYTTEAAASEVTLSEVVLSLKNAPTNNTITVDILKENAVNSNVFVSIFSTLPTIEINEFTSQTAVAAVFSDSTWQIERRLQLVLTINDDDFAATGIKVTLA